MKLRAIVGGTVSFTMAGAIVVEFGDCNRYGVGWWCKGREVGCEANEFGRRAR